MPKPHRQPNLERDALDTGIQQLLIGMCGTCDHLCARIENFTCVSGGHGNAIRRHDIPANTCLGHVVVMSIRNRSGSFIDLVFTGLESDPCRYVRATNLRQHIS